MRHARFLPSAAFAITLSLAFFACSDSSGDDNEEISSSSELSSSSAEISSSSEVVSSSSVIESSSSVAESSSSSSELNEESSSSAEVSSSSTPSSSSSSTPSSSSSISITKDSFTDTRDGQTYEYVTIGTQTWMAENLNFATESGSWCYEEKEANCDIYGMLYDWATAMDIDAVYNTSSYTAGAKHQGVCPTDWHLPSDAEWTTLTDYVGGSSIAGTKLKATSGWNSSGNGTDDYGFSALPGGVGSGGVFSSVGINGYWWSATEKENNASNAYYRYMPQNGGLVYGDNIDKDNFLLSVRCVKD